MTEKDLLLLENIKANVNTVFAEFNLLLSKNEHLRKALNEKEIALQSLADKYKKLEEENHKLRLANQLMSKNDKDNLAKKEINTIIREIDKCIALLNK